MKSAKTWDLIADLLSKSIVCSDNSVAHLAILDEASLLMNKSFKGWSVSTVCRMDLPGPTTSVGTRTNYSVGPWDYPTCAARYLMA
jgi:hypothetical protein